MKLAIVLFALFELAQGIAGLVLAFLMLLFLLVIAGLIVRTLVRPLGLK